MRDDFPQAVKDKLAKRACYVCCNPACRHKTVGPSEAKQGVSMIGVAAHICAASPGGKRYDASMTSEERSSFDNGIWLCQNCAHLIDTDDVRFTVELLKKWKQDSEQQAHEAISSSKSANFVSTVSSALDDETKNQIIAAVRCIFEIGNSIRENYKHYQIGYDVTSDFAVYNSSVTIIKEAYKLSSIETNNHMQFHYLKLDVKILKILRLVPPFYDAMNDATGGNLVYTVSNYINFFNSKEGNYFLTLCNELIKDIENT